MSYIVTFNPGTDDEESQVIRYLMDFDAILEDLEEWPDGFSVMIRKANYLDVKTPDMVVSGVMTGRMHHDRSFIEEVERPVLTLLPGGKS
jgi:hypothetical protein